MTETQKKDLIFEIVSEICENAGLEMTPLRSLTTARFHDRPAFACYESGEFERFAAGMTPGEGDVMNLPGHLLDAFKEMVRDNVAGRACVVEWWWSASAQALMPYLTSAATLKARGAACTPYGAYGSDNSVFAYYEYKTDSHQIGFFKCGDRSIVAIYFDKNKNFVSDEEAFGALDGID